MGIALVLFALAVAGCGGGDEEPSTPNREDPSGGPAAAEEYDLVLPDDGVEGDPPPGISGE